MIEASIVILPPLYETTELKGTRVVKGVVYSRCSAEWTFLKGFDEDPEQAELTMVRCRSTVRQRPGTLLSRSKSSIIVLLVT